MNGKGRILIPSEVRNRLGLKSGDSLYVEIQGNDIVLRTLGIESAEKPKTEGLKEFLSEE